MQLTNSAAVNHLLWEWGDAILQARAGRGLTTGDVARLVGLGERLTAEDVARAEAGHGSVETLIEVTEALGCGARVHLEPAADIQAAWAAGARDRLAVRRARRTLGMLD